MSDHPLPVKACVFDAYGTLFDIATATAACNDILEGKAAELTGLWRAKQLQYTWLRSLQNRHTDFWTVTGEALDFSLDTLGFHGRVMRERLMAAYRQLGCFEEVPAVLQQLREAGMKTAVLSNGSPAMLAAAIKASALDRQFDGVFSADEVGVFKPHPSVYQLAVDRLGLPADKIVFLSSNGWDAHGASAFGMRAIWCNRYAQRAERLPGRPDHVIKSLRELPPLVRHERSMTAG